MKLVNLFNLIFHRDLSAPVDNHIYEELRRLGEDIRAEHQALIAGQERLHAGQRDINSRIDGVVGEIRRVNHNDDNVG